MDSSLTQQLKETISGEVLDDTASLSLYSHDASIFEVTPQVVVVPKTVEDIENLVKFINSNKKKDPTLSLTARSAGTDMTAGSLNESVIVDFQKYLNKFISLKENIATAEPGIFYRDFEKETLKKELVFPAYPASLEICSLGGIVSNNAGGEKSLNYGKIEDYIESLNVVLADGKEYTIRALNDNELKEKMRRNDFEGKIYRKMFALITKNYNLLSKAAPDVSKNSAGYFLWNVFDKETHMFDLTKLLVGSQGTLGLITRVQVRLVPKAKHSELLILYLSNLDHLPEVIETALLFKPESLETYDDHTFKLAVKYYISFFKLMKSKNFFEHTWHFLPDILTALTGSVPKLVIQVEFAGNDRREIEGKIQALSVQLKPFKITYKIAASVKSQRKYWLFRRESFNLLRHKITDKHVAPFIEDFALHPEYLKEFLPRLDKVFKKYPPLVYTIAGHIGDGNFHIMPFLDLADEKQREIILHLGKDVYDLVLEYKGTITAEHNDGLVRTPYLKHMYGEKVYALFKQTKQIFDPDGIFNPRKKVGGSMKYTMDHIRTEW